MIQEIRWDKRVPIFKNRLILKQLGLGIGIPFGILILIFLLIQAYYGLLMVTVLLILTFLFVLVYYRGTYDVQYVINAKGILCENQPNQTARVKRLSNVTFWLGLAARNPTTAGAGLLSGSSTSVFIPWKRIRKIRYYDRQHSLLVKGGFSENIALFCTDENYEAVKQFIGEKVKTN